jgi:hypothetical protein
MTWPQDMVKKLKSFVSNARGVDEAARRPYPAR